MRDFRTYDLAIEFYERCRETRTPNRAIKDQFEREAIYAVRKEHETEES